MFGYHALARACHQRYSLPLMHTETNLQEGGSGHKAAEWLRRTLAVIRQLSLEGVPICGMTWHLLTDRIDWDVALREKNDRVNPLGLCNLDRQIRHAGVAFEKLVEQWRDSPLLPYGPFSIVGGLDGTVET